MQVNLISHQASNYQINVQPLTTSNLYHPVTFYFISFILSSRHYSISVLLRQVHHNHQRVSTRLQYTVARSNSTLQGWRIFPTQKKSDNLTTWLTSVLLQRFLNNPQSRPLHHLNSQCWPDSSRHWYYTFMILCPAGTKPQKIQSL